MLHVQLALVWARLVFFDSFLESPMGRGRIYLLAVEQLFDVVAREFVNGQVQVNYTGICRNSSKTRVDL